MKTIIVIFLSIALAQKVYCQNFDIEFINAHKDIIIKNEFVEMRSTLIYPEIQPELLENEWKFVKTIKKNLSIAGMLGKNTIDQFSNKDILFERQVWLSNDKKVVAIRQTIKNNGMHPISLSNMIPLACNSQGSLVIRDNNNPANWNIMVQKRHKHDYPEVIIPGNYFSVQINRSTQIVNDANYSKDSLRNRNMVNNDLPVHSQTVLSPLVKADPFFLIPVQPATSGKALLVGYLNQNEHLAHSELSFEEDNGNVILSYFKSICEFNGITIPANVEKTGQWIYLSVGSTQIKTIEDYTDKVSKYYQLAPLPKNAPTVYCTWYYHGWSYNEKLLNKDIETFRKDRLPFDVFLIDESWDVDNWGDMLPNKLWPGGMKHAADLIKEIGYKPGIWTCPFLVDSGSIVAKTHPEWLLKTSGGNNYTFLMNGTNHWVFDLTYPGVLEYLERIFHKISFEWGFKYFKFDFMRAVILDKDYEMYNPLVNRLEAYKMGLEAIRRGVGDDAYISVCGGHYGGSIGIADSQRSGNDVFSWWDTEELAKYRQNILRTWMSRLWHVDPDAMMVRRSNKEVHSGRYGDLSLGRFNDNEAQVNALNQYIGGGLVSFSEDFAILDEDRKALYKHVIPSVNSSSIPLDWNNPILPSFMLTKIDPVCKNLGKWNTLSIINWTERNSNTSFALDDAVLQDLVGEKFLVFEFFSQQVKGLYSRQEIVDFGILSPRKALLVKIIPWNGKTPVLAGTDLHFSMGGVEIRKWHTGKNSVRGVSETKWPYPINLTTVFPDGNCGFKIQTVKIHPGTEKFHCFSN